MEQNGRTSTARRRTASCHAETASWREGEEITRAIGMAARAALFVAAVMLFILILIYLPYTVKMVLPSMSRHVV